MAAVTHIGNLDAHVRCQLVLHARIEGIAISDAQRLGIDVDQRKQILRAGRLRSAAAGVLVARLEDAGISAAAPVKGAADRILALESRGKGIRNTIKVWHAGRKVNDTERTAEHDLFPGRVGQTNLRSEIRRVFIFLEAVAAVLGIDESTRNSKRGINRLKVVVCPGTVLLVEPEVVVPAQTEVHSKVGTELVAVLDIERHLLFPPIQIKGSGLAGSLYVT